MTTIALAGKGGTGKTTIAGLMVRWLLANRKTPVLAVDADANANLNEALGVSYAATVGGVREDARAKAGALGGMAKQQFLEARINQALVESEGFDLIVMGRPEGPGCYCFANNVLRDVLGRISKSYPFIVVDCEAGLEHLSRRTLLEVDWLVVVSDPSIRGLKTARRVGEVVEELKTRVKRRALIINRMDKGSSLNEKQEQAVKECGMEKVFQLPFDEAVRDMDEKGGTIKDIGEDNAIYKAVSGVMADILK
ncbi:MAG TPA: AAA family ATPase [Chitinivibrionales bacterium]|nr:AAA family ATPase [Chitinivibrionales bacterium]